jgi:hypothetical protein
MVVVDSYTGCCEILLSNLTLMSLQLLSNYVAPLTS